MGGAGRVHERARLYYAELGETLPVIVGSKLFVFNKRETARDFKRARQYALGNLEIWEVEVKNPTKQIYGAQVWKYAKNASLKSVSDYLATSTFSAIKEFWEGKSGFCLTEGVYSVDSVKLIKKIH